MSWILFTLMAVFFQTFRNAIQSKLSATVPTLGVCLHADMSAIDFAITNQQLSLAIAVSEQLMSSAAQLNKLRDAVRAALQSVQAWELSCANVHS